MNHTTARTHTHMFHNHHNFHFCLLLHRQTTLLCTHSRHIHTCMCSFIHSLILVRFLCASVAAWWILFNWMRSAFWIRQKLNRYSSISINCANWKIQQIHFGVGVGYDYYLLLLRYSLYIITITHKHTWTCWLCTVPICSNVDVFQIITFDFPLQQQYRIRLFIYANSNNKNNIEMIMTMLITHKTSSLWRGEETYTLTITNNAMRCLPWKIFGRNFYFMQLFLHIECCWCLSSCSPLLLWCEFRYFFFFCRRCEFQSMAVFVTQTTKRQRQP